MFWKKFGKLRKKGIEIELHEIFLDKLAKKREKDFGLSEQKFEVPLSQKKLRVFYIAFLIMLCFFFAKTFQLQIIEGKRFRELSEKNMERLYLVQPIRGVIYDSSMKQLVFNKPSYDLVLNIKEMPYSEQKKEREIREIAQLISEDPSEIKQKIRESEFNTVLIKENLDHETLILLETKLKDFPGFQIKENTIREYIDGEFYAHFIGFCGKISKEELQKMSNYSVTDYIGKQGIEKSYEDILRGKPGKVMIKRDALGNKIGEEIFSPTEPGESLVLWIDSELQKKLTEALQKSMDNVGSKKGAAVVMDPNTGGILAMVSLPSFDNNLFSQGISYQEFQALNEDPLQPLFNRVVSGGYPVGSTIKPLIASAALQEKIIDPDKDILCKGKIVIPNPYLPDKPSVFLDWKTHGWVNLRKAIAESCNVYFYMLGGGYEDFKGLGVKRIKKYLELFGWGKETGIDLPGEIKGRIPDPEWKENYFRDPQKKIWRIGDTYHLSIGQGDISVTPLQVVTAFSAVANGGTLYKPQIVKEIVKGSADAFEVVKKFEPQIIRKDFIDPKNLEIVREGMREGVIYGSSRVLGDLPVKVASKTGTAETSREGFYHNWVTVIAPYEHPKIVLTVVIEDVEGVKFAALPVAKEVLNWYFSR
ncbi:penicillin-binding protein 2 [bacterium]|nr:penicillin-binding protein 2 [bacterium]